MKKVKIPRLRPSKLFTDRLRRERAGKSMDYEDAKTLPRITNETVAEHREEVLSTARKYIYPLQHSKHRIVVISSILFIVSFVVFFVYVFLALYRFQTTSTFIYRVTQVIPFPVAKTNVGYVTYENYLFELRHFVHYYETQQKVDFTTKNGKEQLDSFRERSLDQVVDRAYVKDLAKKNKITVSEDEISRTIKLLKSQNRLGSSDQVFQDVLKEYWGWSVDDFRRELRMELLEQKVIAKLDTSASNKASTALEKIAAGGDFAVIAKEMSDDQVTKGQGGQYGFAIKKNNRDIPPQVIDELFKLQAGQTTDIINTGSALEINKVLEVSGDQIKAAHIVFALKPLDSFIDPITKKDKPSLFIQVE